MRLVEISRDSRGYTLSVEDNGVGGRRYWSDEIGGGVVVWDTSLVSAEMMQSALLAEESKFVDDRLLQDMPKEDIPPVDRNQKELSSGGPVTTDHKDINPETGMQKSYVVLTKEERAKGFIRPVRQSYTHKACNSITTMAPSIAETYARDPKFYVGTYCALCKTHSPVKEFLWYGTDEEVGS